MKTGQYNFGFFGDYTKAFGGSLIKGKRREARPLSTKHPIHLVLKSEGNRLFNPSNHKLESLIRNQARKYGIIIYDLSLNWSHIHIAMKLPTRASYKAFIRTVTALTVEFLSKQLRKNLKGLFDLRPYTRILSGWRREFRKLLDYVIKNQLEAWGLTKREKKSKPKKKQKPELSSS